MRSKLQNAVALTDQSKVVRRREARV